jgi:chromosome segregation ATPase
VLRKHELEFLNEYKNRMYTIQKQMRALKEKANEEESRRRKAEKIAALEQERDSLRQKAEMLDKVCKEYKKGVEKWKNKSDALEDDRKFLEEQILAAKKQNSRLQEQLGMLQRSSEQTHVNALAP